MLEQELTFDEIDMVDGGSSWGQVSAILAGGGAIYGVGFALGGPVAWGVAAGAFAISSAAAAYISESK
jgi:hypothetical protein